jgi:SPOR domain
MADDNILRSYRSNEPARRTSAPAGPRDVGGNDPLAELARLIGQSDPFSEPDRGGGYVPETRQRTDSSPSDWRKTAAAMARESMRATPVADPHFEQVDSAIAAARSLRASPGDQLAYQPHSPHAGYDQAADPEAGYADCYDDEPHGGVAMDEGLHAPHQAAAQQGDHESENYFFDGAATPSDDRFYDDPPRSRKTNGLVTAVVLIGCGILGTAGAYGYRTYHSGVRATDAPIISAEKLPNKMVPAPAGGDPASGKSIERIGASNERVVTRQEEPVAFTDPNGPRGVLPPPFTTSPGPGPSAQSSGAATEPKKVKTVPIRPEGADPTARPINIVGSPPQQLTSSPPPAATRQLPPSKPVAAAARNGAAPLSLEPQGQPADSAPRASAAPTATPRLASAASTAPGGSAASGGYVVQISSQRSEAEAQASIRGLQAKFPSQLGNREASVRRADLGEKGVYYRAMVGPFGSAGDADQFCGGLKAAGGQCIVQKN